MDMANDSWRGPFPIPADARLREDPKCGSKQPAFEMYVRKVRDAELSICNYFEPRTCPKVKLRRMHFLGSCNTARKLFELLLSKFKENEAANLLW